MEMEFYELGKLDEDNLSFSAISTVYQGKWLYVRNKSRSTQEIPGGRKEAGERIDNTARRELFEETGARKYFIKPICDYLVNDSCKKTFGRLFFCEINEIDDLPESEIAEIRLFDEIPANLTYPEIQTRLFRKTQILKCDINPQAHSAHRKKRKFT